jgi:hypothetical protein
MPISTFPIDFVDNIEDIISPVGGSYQKNASLKDYYIGKSEGYERDIEFLQDQIKNIDPIQKELVVRAAPTDRQMAESVVAYNQYINIIKSASDDGISCGCSFVGVTTVSIGTTQFVNYDVCQADKKNLNSGTYGGTEPLKDVGSINIVSAASPTTIQSGNLGDGQDTFIADGDQVEYYRLQNVEPLISCGNCINLYNQQTQALADLATEGSNPIRSSAKSRSDAIKAEREELLKERWTLTFGKKETETRLAQVRTFQQGA